MLVKDIMERKVHFVKEDMSIQDVALLLIETGVSGVPVIDDDHHVIGMVSEADLIQKEKEPRLPSYIDILGNILFVEGVKRYEKELKKLVATNVGEIMTTNVRYVYEEDPSETVAEIMVEDNINRVPVVNHEKKLVGIISRHDMLKLLI